MATRTSSAQGKGAKRSPRGVAGDTTNVKEKDKKNSETGGKQGGAKKTSTYGQQMAEKNLGRNFYGLREKQFKRFFAEAQRQHGATGENLLSLLERRIDNVVFSLKLASTRPQARQMIVHGHIRVNGHKVSSPSSLVKAGDLVSLKDGTLEKKGFVETVINKRLNIGVKVPAWLELKKSEYKGQVLRFPERSEVAVDIKEHLVVELYSK